MLQRGGRTEARSAAAMPCSAETHASISIVTTSPTKCGNPDEMELRANVKVEATAVMLWIDPGEVAGACPVRAASLWECLSRPWSV